MSDAFLKGLEDNSKKSTANLSYAEKRRKAINKGQQRGLTVSRKEREAAARDEGLGRNLIVEARMKEAQPVYSTPEASTSTVSSDNKALDMMRKMGFTPGQALGKRKEASPNPDDNEPARSKPRTTPIGFQLKTGRGGLGREEARKFRLDPNAPLPPELRESQAQYLASVREQFDDRKAESVLKGARRTCEELDRRIGMEKSVMWLDPFEVEKDMRRKIQAKRLGEYVSDDEDEVEYDDLKKVRASLEDEVVDEDGLTSREEWLEMDVCRFLAHSTSADGRRRRLEQDWARRYITCGQSICELTT